MIPKLFARERYVLIIGISVLSWTLVLNRWLFTDLGKYSFGRLWPFFVSWTDFGFARRSLVGTLLTYTGLNRVIDDQYVWSFAFYALLLLFLTLLIAKPFLTAPPLDKDPWLCAAIFLSPAFLSHLAYATGSLDVILVILFVLVVVQMSSPTWISVIVIAAVLTHEIFVFMVPSAIVVLAIDNQKKIDNQEITLRKSIVRLAGITGAAVLTFIVLQLFGRLNVDQVLYEDFMRERLPLASTDNPWSGYFELTSSTSENVWIDVGLIVDNLVFMIGPTTYALLAAFAAARGLQKSRPWKYAVLLSNLLPLCIFVVASDYYRWVSISAILSLVTILSLTLKGHAKVSRSLLVALTGFAIVAPFGAAGLGRPFPLHQLVLERLT